MEDNKLQIKWEIENKEWQINEYRMKIGAKSGEIKLFEELSEKCARLNKKIINSLESIRNDIRLKCNKLSKNNKFKIQYRTQTDKILKGKRMNSVIEAIGDTNKGLKKRIINQKDDIAEYRQRIRALENDIEILKRELERMV